MTFNGTKGRLEHKVVDSRASRSGRQRPGAGEGLRHLAAVHPLRKPAYDRRAAHRQGEPRRRRRRDAGRSVRAHARRRPAVARGRRAQRRVFDPGRRGGQPLLRDGRDRAHRRSGRPIAAPDIRACRRAPRPCRCRPRSDHGPAGTALADRCEGCSPRRQLRGFWPGPAPRPWRRCHGRRGSGGSRSPSSCSTTTCSSTPGCSRAGSPAS